MGNLGTMGLVFEDLRGRKTTPWEKVWLPRTCAWRHQLHRKHNAARRLQYHSLSLTVLREIYQCKCPDESIWIYIWNVESKMKCLVYLTSIFFYLNLLNKTYKKIGPSTCLLVPLLWKKIHHAWCTKLLVHLVLRQMIGKKRIWSWTQYFTIIYSPILYMYDF